MPVDAWDVATVLAKALTYAATLSAAGGVFFLTYSHALLSSQDRLRVRRLTGILLAAAVLATGLRIPLLVGSMSGDIAGIFDGTMTSMLLRAGEGRAGGLRLAGLLLAGTALRSQQGPPVVAILGAAVAAISFAAIGHAAAAVSPALPIALLGLHLLCVAFWLGALGPLLWVARGTDLARVAATAARFGNAALVVVALLIVAGALLLSMLIGSIAALWTSSYGRWVLLKLGLVACLLGLAAFNKLRLTVRLAAGDPRAARSLRRSITAEMLIGASILLVTATFTSLMGPPHPP